MQIYNQKCSSCKCNYLVVLPVVIICKRDLQDLQCAQIFGKSGGTKDKYILVVEVFSMVPLQ